MRAQVTQKFRYGFLLSEESLVKIVDIVEKRLKSENGDPISLNYDVGRVDYALITYDDVHEVFKEENGKTDRISSLRIYSNKKGDYFQLIFEKGEPTSLYIVSSYRDRALLTHADIREYVNNEVTVRKFGFVWGVISHKLTPYFVLIVTLISMMGALFRVSSEMKISAPENPNISQKIDFLYRKSLAMDDGILIEKLLYWLAFTPITVLLFFIFIFVSWNYLYQTDIFLFGKEKNRYENVNSLKSKILWGVGVATLISVVSGVLIEHLK